MMQEAGLVPTSDSCKYTPETVTAEAAARPSPLHNLIEAAKGGKEGNLLLVLVEKVVERGERFDLEQVAVEQELASER